MASCRVRGRTLVAAGLLVSSASLFGACGSEDAHPLAANAWLMTGAVDHGAAVNIPTEIRWRFLEDGGCDEDAGCPNGPKLVGNDVCNDFVRSFRFEGNEVVWGDYWLSTAVGCPGGLSDTLLQMFKSDSLRYEIVGNELHLNSPEAMAELTFRRSD